MHFNGFRGLLALAVGIVLSVAVAPPVAAAPIHVLTGLDRPDASAFLVIDNNPFSDSLAVGPGQFLSTKRFVSDTTNWRISGVAMATLVVTEEESYETLSIKARYRHLTAPSGPDHAADITPNLRSGTFSFSVTNSDIGNWRPAAGGAFTGSVQQSAIRAKHHPRSDGSAPHFDAMFVDLRAYGSMLPDGTTSLFCNFLVGGLNCGYTMTFTARHSTATVPLPASGVLAGSGLAATGALAVWRRRRGDRPVAA